MEPQKMVDLIFQREIPTVRNSCLSSISTTLTINKKLGISWIESIKTGNYDIMQSVRVGERLTEDWILIGMQVYKKTITIEE